MAVYPAGNPGVYPVDTTTDVGLFRIEITDTNGTPYVPNESGYANFAKMSDAEIEALLLKYGSVNWSLYRYFKALAGSAAEVAKVVADSDLKLDNTKRAEALMTVALGYKEDAIREDELNADNDVFELLPALGSGLYPGIIEGF